MTRLKGALVDVTLSILKTTIIKIAIYLERLLYGHIIVIIGILI
jgi:hypothetical protein